MQLATIDDAPVTVAASEPAYLPVSKLRKQYLDFLHVKRTEIEEAKQARHYYHGNQWTEKDIATLKKRRQPVVTSNRISRKIDGVIGLVERLKQDPKAYPRTPQHEQGADLATAALRYVLDISESDAKLPEVARDASTSGIGAVELLIQPGDMGDPEISFDVVDSDLFFYDPRSFRADFSDARFMGVSRWVSDDVASEMFPDKADVISGLMTDDGGVFGQASDREKKWVDSDSKKLRLVEHWYRSAGGWLWAFYVGETVLAEGESPFVDEKGELQSKYIAFSANVDQDGDRYGFVRLMKSAQDEINARRSKALHYLNTRRIIIEDGAVDDVEATRREAMRPDGVIVKKPGLEFQFDDTARQNDMVGQLKFLEDSKTEIENFGPNPAILGQGVENKSGRAIALLQQAGIAELGPFIIGYKGFKVRLYRALWNAIQRHWQAERWIRVTDDEGLAQFVQVNGVDVDEFGRPAVVNAVGSLDVDIVLDEGPDNFNAATDAYDALTALAGAGAQIPPGLLIELAPGIPQNVKRKYLQQMQQMQAPDPAKEQAQQLAIEEGKAKIGETRSRALKNFADATSKLGQTAQQYMQPQMTGMMNEYGGAPEPMGPVEQSFQ